MTYYAPQPQHLTRAHRKLIQFAVLPAGWHYGRGGPIGAEVLKSAIAVVNHLVMGGISRTDAFPGTEGEVQVTGYHGDHFVSVDVNPDGTFDVSHEVGRVECCAESGTRWPAVKGVIDGVAREIWGTSGSFTQGIGTQYVVASPTSHSRNPPTEGSRSSHSTAPRPRANASADTSRHSIPA